MISGGRLRFIATQSIQSTARDDLGMRTDTWTTGGTMRVDLRSDSAQEQSYADGVAVVRNFEVRARWGSAQNISLNETHRLEVNGHTLKIRAIRNLDEADRVAVIDCESVT